MGILFYFINDKLIIQQNRAIVKFILVKVIFCPHDYFADEALERLRKFPDYIDTVTINFSANSCDYIISNTGGSSRQINATGTVVDTVRKVQIIISDNDPLTVSSWQEVSG